MRASQATRQLVADTAAEVVVADVLTVAAALAAELEGRPWVTLVPHVLPTPERGLPPYSIGARMPRTALGQRFWALLHPLVRGGEKRGRVELNGARARVGLPPLHHLHGGVSRQLALVATFPQLEYPRRERHPWVQVTGPLLWERPYPDTEPPPGDEPLVLVAPSTSQDPEQRLVRAALEGLARQPVRVLATTNGRAPAERLPEPENSMLVDWVSYSKTMPRCAAVVCHAGHGTVARALASGTPVVACAAEGDQAENAARVAWAGAGVSLPRRLTTPWGVRLAVRKVLDNERYARRAAEFKAWVERHDGAAAAAEALEEFARNAVPQRAVRGLVELGGWDSNPQRRG